MFDKYLNKKSLQSFQSFTACDMISRNLDDEWEIDQFQGKGAQILRWCYLESTTNNAMIIKQMKILIDMTKPT